MGFRIRFRTWALSLLLLLLLLLLSLPAAVGAQNSQAGWQATYWNNIDLSGDPVLRIFESDQGSNPSLDRNWGTWRPWPQVETDQFSARWERTLTLQPGRYRFTGTADDGMRVFVNGVKIIDEWQNTVVRAYTGYADVPREGPVTIVVEYYEFTNDAVAKLTWDRIYGSDGIITGQTFVPRITGWRGEYFNSREPVGLPIYVRDDAEINFDWGIDSPVPEAIRSEGFSVRWSRTVNLPAGTYRFKTETDDGARLYVNNQLILDHWQSQTFAAHTADWNHQGGSLKIVMEYYDELGLAAARLSWERLGEATPIRPAGPAGIWSAEYFNNTILATGPVGVRQEQAIDFDWDRPTSPVPQYIQREGYSARFKATLSLPRGKYRFVVTVDDGARLWINEKLVLDKWRKHPEITYSVDLDLPGGRTPVQLEYVNMEGDGRIRLTYERLDGPLTEGGQPGAGSGAGSPGGPPTTDSGSVVRVRTSRAKVRAAASSIAPVLTTLRRAQTAPLTGRSLYNTWVQIRLPDGSSGWLSVLDIQPLPDIDALPIVEEPVEPTGEETLPPGPKAVVVRSTLNQVRSRPNMMSDVLTILPVNKAVPVLGRNRFTTWIKVELPDGRSGWIGAFYVTADYDLSLLPETGD